MQSAALLAYESLGCRDMSRVDFIVDAAGDAYVLEINTIPGFTSHSLLPMAAAKSRARVSPGTRAPAAGGVPSGRGLPSIRGSGGWPVARCRAP